MVKHKEQYDDDIDLLELFLIFWKYKTTFASLMVIGLILGLAFTYQQVPRYETEFNVIVGHPAYKPSLLSSSSSLQDLLSQAELSPAKMPRFVTRQSKNTESISFQVQSHSPDVHEEIRMRFKKIIATKLEQQKNLILIDRVKTGIHRNLDDIDSILHYTAIAESSVEDILKEFQVTFGPTKTVQPNPRMYGIFGIFAGLLLAGCWVVLSLFYRAIQKKDSLKR